MEDSKNTEQFKICQIGAFHGEAGKTPSNADTLKDSLISIGIGTIWASRYTAPLQRVSDMLQTLIRHRSQYRIVLLHVYSGRAFLWTLLATIIAKLLQKKLVLWLHGGNLPDYYRNNRRSVSFVFNRSDRIVAPSEYLADTFQEDFKVDILPYELPINSYPLGSRSHVRPKLLWLRAFNSGYNPTMAPKVVKLLKEKYPNVEFVMCGPDNGDGSFQSTKQIAKEIGVENNIRYPGLVSKDDIKQYGNSMDLFINTTNYDNTPVSVIEAMAMGMCVVTTNVGGIPYLVEDGRDGLLTPPNDPEAMAAACDKILSDQELAMNLSSNARRKAEQFDWDNIAPLWEDILTSLHNESNTGSRNT